MGIVMWIANLFSGGKVKILLAAVAGLATAVLAVVPAGPVAEAAKWILGLLTGLGILSGGTENLQPPAVKAAVAELRTASSPSSPGVTSSGDRPGFDPFRQP